MDLIPTTNQDPIVLAVRDRLCTHHAKMLNPSGSVQIFARESITPDCLAAKTGVHSRSLAETRYALGLTSSGATITLARDLSCDADASAFGNALGILMSGNEEVAETLGRKREKRIADFPKRKIGPLTETTKRLRSDPLLRHAIRDTINAAPDKVPGYVDAALKSVFFEGPADGTDATPRNAEILLTPLPSAKVASELALRLNAPRQDDVVAAVDEKAADKPQDAGKKVEKTYVPHVHMPSGGSNPQNAGYALMPSASTARFSGRVPLLLARVPQTYPTTLLSRVKAAGAITAIGVGARDSFLYAERIRTGIRVGPIRMREANHARAWAVDVVEQVEAIQATIQESGRPFEDDRMPPAQLRVLNRKAERDDSTRVGEAFANVAIIDVAETLKRRSANPTAIPDEAIEVLRKAFVKAFEEMRK